MLGPTESKSVENQAGANRPIVNMRFPGPGGEREDGLAADQPGRLVAWLLEMLAYGAAGLVLTAILLTLLGANLWLLLAIRDLLR